MSEEEKQRRYEVSRRWVLKNIERVRELKRNWKKRNPENKRAYKHRKRLRLIDSPFPLQEWKELLEFFNGWCPYCGEAEQKLSVDHVVPVVKGGTNDISNLIPCCISCNTLKHTRLLEEWISPD